MASRAQRPVFPMGSGRRRRLHSQPNSAAMLFFLLLLLLPVLRRLSPDSPARPATWLRFQALGGPAGRETLCPAEGGGERQRLVRPGSLRPRLRLTHCAAAILVSDRKSVV